MTFSDYLALAAVLVALPEGAVCSTAPQYFTRHWYEGKRECRRCGHPSPYPVSVVDEALAVAARAEEQS